MADGGKPVAQPGILDIEAYVPGKSKLAGVGPVIKLSSNETPLGPSPKAVEAYREAASQLERYPDGMATPLREAIAHRYGLNASHIVGGAGSDEILNLLANAYIGPGDEAIYTEHGFLVYKIAIMANGGVPVVAPETDFTTDVDAILERVTPKTKIVFIANPNNPTGTYIPFDEVQRLRKGLPESVLLVLDGAYAEYVSMNDYEAGIKLVSSTANTVMTRTFSKIHGLAALRIGWGYMPEEIADVLNRIRGPFNLSSMAIAAGAASIEDVGHMDQARAHNEKWLVKTTEALIATGLEVTPSVGNFILIHFPQTSGKTAQDADLFLNKNRIVLRHVKSYGLPNCLRMTIGSTEDNMAVISALQILMKDGADV